jgi:hypothetical protein
VYFPATFRLRYRGSDRASRTRLFALCWIGVLMVFFSFSTTQEYYSMPIYPALALLLGCAMASSSFSAWLRRADVALGALCALASAAIIYILAHVWSLPVPGDISGALEEQSASAYTLSLAHLGDLTLRSFAYLRQPLVLALIAFLIGLFGIVFLRRSSRFVAIAAMMMMFFQAARVALVSFDPYLSSRELANALLNSPPGQLIADDQYYTFSSVFFYADRKAYLHNGRINNLEYGSYAPDAPDVFIDDAQLATMWRGPSRYYLLVAGTALPGIEGAIGKNNYTVVKESGGKYLLVNRSTSGPAALSGPQPSSRALP